MGVADTKGSSARTRHSPPRMAGGGSTFFNVMARLLAWYTLYTVLFRCPSVPTNDSPTVCHTSHAISKALQPHVYPYYDAYVSPYIVQYGPYMRQVNENYIVPAYSSASASYEKFAAPHVSRGQEYATRGYKKSVEPRIEQASKQARLFYYSYLSPHVASAGKFYVKAGPHLVRLNRFLEYIHIRVMIPVYEQSLPYVIKAYEQATHVIVTVVAPLVRANGEKAVGWGVGVWSDVVRPQVGRIGERLGGTGNGAPAPATGGISASIFSSLSSTNAARATASAESLSSIISSASAQAAEAKASKAAEADESKQPEGHAERPTKNDVRGIIEADLHNWKSKFEGAAKKAAANLNVQIDGISAAAQKNKAAHVKEETNTLARLIQREFALLKKTAQGLAKLSELDHETARAHKQAAEDAFLAKTKETGIKIRDKAQSIRAESREFLANVYDDVAAAADSHLGALDSVLDVAVQELGMKWAWMDHVTYKDWERYHELKKDFEGFKKEVLMAAQRNQRLIDITRWTESDWEGKATELAREAADELKRLKEVSKRKIQMSDHTDDFSDSILPASAMNVAQAVIREVENAMDASERLASKASEELVGTKEPTAQSAASVVSGQMGNIVNAASAEVYGTAEAVLGREEPYPVASSVSSAPSGTKESAKAKVFGGVYAGSAAAARVDYDDEEAAGEKARSFVDAANEKLADASRAVSEAIAGSRSTQSPGERYASIASEKYESAVSAASSVLYGTPQPAGESVLSIATDKYSAAADAAVEKYESLKALVSELAVGREPDFTESIMSRFSSLVYGTQAPFLARATSTINESFESATSAIGSMMTPPPALEGIIAAANEQAQAAIAAASEQVYGTPKGTVESVTSVVGEAYQSAQSRVSEAVYGHKTGAIESASSRMSSAVESAKKAISEAVYGTSKGPVERATDTIADAVGDGYSAASEAAASAYSTVSSAIHGPAQSLVDSAHRRLESALETGISSLSEMVYGTQAGYLERATQAAATAVSSVSSIVAPPEQKAYEKVASSISSAAGHATERVKEAYEAVHEEL